MKKKNLQPLPELSLSFEECLNRMQLKTEEVAERVHRAVERLYCIEKRKKRDEWQDWNIREQLE